MSCSGECVPAVVHLTEHGGVRGGLDVYTIPITCLMARVLPSHPYAEPFVGCGSFSVNTSESAD